MLSGPYNEAECKPRVAFDDMTGVVTAVVALTDDALVAFDLLAEGVLAASEDETHGGVGWRWKWESVASRSWVLNRGGCQEAKYINGALFSQSKQQCMVVWQ